MAFRNPQCHVVVTNVISAWGLLLLLLKNWIHFSLIPTFVETRDKLRPWPPRQQAVLALCQWPQSPQNWQMDKARSFYSTTEEELTAAISPTYFCKGGTAMQLPEELTTFKKKQREFSTTEFVTYRLWVSISYLSGLLPEANTCSSVYIQIVLFQVTVTSCDNTFLCWGYQQIWGFYSGDENKIIGPEQGGKLLPGHHILVESLQFMYYSKSRFCS